MTVRSVPPASHLLYHSNRGVVNNYGVWPSSNIRRPKITNIPRTLALGGLPENSLAGEKTCNFGDFERLDRWYDGVRMSGLEFNPLGCQRVFFLKKIE